MNEAQPRMTVGELFSAIERFINHRRDSNLTEERWLASYMAEPLRIVRQVNYSNLNQELRDRVNAFRCAEIEKEVKDLQKQAAELEKEAKRLMPEPAVGEVAWQQKT